MVVDIRYLPNQDPGDILEQIRAIPDIEVARTFIREPAYVSRTNPYVLALVRRRSARLTQRRVDERRPRRRLGRGLVPRGGRPGGRVRPGRRRPPRPRGVGVDLLAGALPPGAVRLRPPACPSGLERADGRSSCAPSRAAWREPAGAGRPRTSGAGLLKRGAARRRSLIVLLDGGRGVGGRASCRSTTIINTIETARAARRSTSPRSTAREAGKPQTLMILGSDQRYGDKKLGLKPRSDTIILVRLDPDKEATAVMSIPRDLKVDIPGYGTDKINAAYELGGPRLTRQDGQEAVLDARQAVQDQPRRQRRLRRLPQGVNYIGCVYVDIDRDYFNDNSGGRELRDDRHRPRLPEAQGPGRARLRPLPPRRQRPRARRAPAGLPAPAAQRGRRAQAARATAAARAAGAGSSPATSTPTRACARRRRSSRCSSSCSSPASKPVHEVRFRVDLTRRPASTSTASPGQARQDRRRVPATRRRRRSRARPRAPRPPTASRASSAQAQAQQALPTCPGSRSRAREGEDQAIVGARRKLDFPFYFPTLRYRRLALRGHRAAHLHDPRRARQEAPRLPARASPRASSASTTASRA